MKKTKYSVTTVLLLFFLPELTMGQNQLISDEVIKETHTVTFNETGHIISFPILALKDFINTGSQILTANNDRSDDLNLYVIREGSLIRLNDHPAANHIIKKYHALVTKIICAPSTIPYQLVWGCSPRGDAYYMVNELYPPDTDFSKLYSNFKNESLRDFANENHVIGEIFFLKAKTVKAESTVTHDLFILSYLGKNIYLLNSDRYFSFLSKEKLIQFIKYPKLNKAPGDLSLFLTRIPIKPSVFSQVDDSVTDQILLSEQELAALKSCKTVSGKGDNEDMEVKNGQLHYSSIITWLNNSYVYLSQKNPLSPDVSILLLLMVATKGLLLSAAWAIDIYKYLYHSQSDSLEMTDNDSGENHKSGQDNKFGKKPEDSIDHGYLQYGETVLATPTHSASQQQHSQNIPDTGFLTDTELRTRVAELQSAYREGGSLELRQQNLLIALVEMLDHLRRIEDIMDILKYRPHVLKQVRKALSNMDNLELTDKVTDTLNKRISKRVL